MCAYRTKTEAVVYLKRLNRRKILVILCDEWTNTNWTQRNQWWKSRNVVWASTMFNSLQASMTPASLVEPDGLPMKLTPLNLARSMLSRNGKNASEANATPDNCWAHSRRSASVSGAGAAPFSKYDSNCFCGKSLPTVPSTKLSIALEISARFTPALNFSEVTRGCWRNHLLNGNHWNYNDLCLSCVTANIYQLSALSPAKRVQWMRDCCPAPMPITWPSRA